ncbi:hypothetical protein PLICRDRAFT_56110 [Plicaturopsis crispa FD-325 SS-3]|nr:hypothetical protein PLICRDRAFT_56110 [Plicaturopsis crispa FD-325 SS-3]
MWCTRWFLPLLLLPMPTAQPYFLILFLFSLMMHARPCFYCIMLLSAIFWSSCHWQPFPLDAQLSAPWDSQIKTFGDALNASIYPVVEMPQPPVIRLQDRCWCDLRSGSVFAPFNVTDWEFTSVQRLAAHMLSRKKREMQSELEEQARARNESSVDTEEDVVTATLPSTSAPVRTGPAALLSTLRSIFRKSHSDPPETSITVNETSSSSERLSVGTFALPPLRKEYDLRSHGLDLIVDFGWSS